MSLKRPKLSRSRGELTRVQIVQTALREIDDLGLAAFSVRNLAARLGVTPMALYWHIPSRDLILAEVVGNIFARCSPAGDLPWREYLRQLFGFYRSTIKVHPNAAPLIGAHLIGNSSIPLSFVEGLLVKLVEAGFHGQSLVEAYNLVIAALAGFITQEFAMVPGDSSDAWHEQLKQRLQAVDSKDHPVLHANLSILAHNSFILRSRSGAEAPLDGSFQRYVQVVLTGLERFARDIRALSPNRKKPRRPQLFL